MLFLVLVRDMTYINSEINANHFFRKASVFNDIFQFIIQ